MSNLFERHEDQWCMTTKRDLPRRIVRAARGAYLAPIVAAWKTPHTLVRSESRDGWDKALSGTR